MAAHPRGAGAPATHKGLSAPLQGSDRPLGQRQRGGREAGGSLRGSSAPHAGVYPLSWGRNTGLVVAEGSGAAPRWGHGGGGG